MLPRIKLSLSLAGLSLVYFTAPAAACFDERCAEPSAVVPEEVPANATGFRIRASVGSDDSAFSLERVDEGAEGVIPMVYLGDALVLEEPLVLGGEYVFLDVETCDGVEEVFERKFVVTEELPGPFVATLEASAPEVAPTWTPTEEGICEEQDALQVELTVWSDDATFLWADYLVWETVVDGEIWRPTFSPATTSDESRTLLTSVHASCPEYSRLSGADGIPEGEHSIRLQAQTPGGDIVLETAAVLVDFVCPVPDCPGAASFDRERGVCNEPVSDVWSDPAACVYGPDPSRGIMCPSDSPGAWEESGCSAAGAVAPDPSVIFSLFGVLLLRRRRSH